MPIPFEQKVIAVLFSLILLLVTLQLIRKHKLREEYALVWFGASLAVFIFSIFDRLDVALASLLGVSYAPTLVLVGGLLFCLVLLLAQTVMLSTQANRIRDLAQTIGLLECRMDELNKSTRLLTPASTAQKDAVSTASADQQMADDEMPAGSTPDKITMAGNIPVGEVRS